MNKIILSILLLFSLQNVAQRATWNKLGTAEKFWVFTHPFSAKKAHRLSQHAMEALDSLKKESYFTYNTNSGSRADALRHCYWMSLLSVHIGPKRALCLGRAHEKKNRKDFEKGSLEEGFLPDSVAITMDLKNNKVGAELGILFKKFTNDQLLKVSINQLIVGNLYFVKQNRDGLFLSIEEQVIPNDEWNGKWKNERVLVPTNWPINQIQN
ncbi:MAG: hypothetical protein JKY48_02195 [Flavobacteriales bacterium]|nr:hypothetical protein [Flavobacteriales bacterium]